MSRPRLVLTRRGLFLMDGASVQAQAGERAQFLAGDPAQFLAGEPAQFLAGEPAQFLAGVVHYARLPAQQLWEPLLERVRMAGLNTVVIPVPWAYHSPAPGFHDFTGPRDIPQLLTAAERLGLWLIPHIGPWLGMGLDGGGVPAWLHRDPQAQPILAAALDGTSDPPAQPFLRHVAAWWEQLMPHLLQQPNLLWLMLHPGLTANRQLLRGYARPLLDLVRRFDPEVLVAMPADALSEVGGGATDPILPWVTLGQRELAKLGPPNSGPTVAPLISLAVLDLTLPLHWTGTEPSDVARVGPAEHPRTLMASAWAQGHVALALDPMHRGVNWGWWAAPGEPTLAGFGAPLAELATPTPVYRAARRTALTFETLGPLLAPASPAYLAEPSADHQAEGEEGGIGDLQPSRRPPSQLRADPSHALAWWRGSALDTRTTGSRTTGTVSVLVDRTGVEALVQLSLRSGPSVVGGSSIGEASLTVEDIPLGPHEIRILPLDWALFDGRLLSTTLEPVLHTLVAGRELLVLRNDVGGEIVLPSDYRHRHSRGPVYPERAPVGIAVHIDPVRIASALFDGPGDHALQILVLEPAWADRVWPLDDAWRSMPYRPASWTPAEEAPARGVVIGPDLVIPEADGGFRFLATDRGFGYRWGPWRGSDPHTWLAPFSWPAAPSVTLPTLDWTACPGAPEVLPDYDDRAWRAFAPSAVLTAEALGVDAGFIWYRAHFDGDADAVTLACRHACDLFLNGEHIAALSPPPPTAP